MRKIRKIGIIALSSILLAGCGKDTNKISLVCTYNAEENNNSIQVTQTFTNKAYDSGYVDFILDGSNVSDMEELKNRDWCTEVMAGLFMTGRDTCTKKIDGKKLIVSADFDLYESVAALNESETVMKFNLDDTRAYFESGGYICSEK